MQQEAQRRKDSVGLSLIGCHIPEGIMDVS
jgi:hypothetical protein